MTDQHDAAPAFDEEDMEWAVIALKAMASRPRLEVLLLLAAEPGVERSVTELQGLLGYLSQSAMSQHLARLRSSRLVRTRREGQTVYYSLQGKRAAKLIAPFKEGL